MTSSLAGVVLSAGLGTRLRPATEHCPKPAVPFMNRPIALHSVAALERAGITRIGVNVHHLPNRMERAYDAVRHRLELFTSHEEVILGTGGGVREIRKRVGRDRTLVVCHGDVVFGHGLDTLIASHRASGLGLTLVLKVRDGSTTLGGVFTDERGEIVKILSGESPRATGRQVEHAFTGVHIIEPEILDRIPASGFSCLVSEVYPELLAQGVPVGAHLTTAFHADLGTYPRFLTAQQQVFQAPGRLDALPWPQDAGEGVFLGPEVRVEAGATITGPVRLEGPVVLEAGSHIGPSVCAQGALRFTSGARVHNSAVWGRGEVQGEVEGVLLALEDGA